MARTGEGRLRRVPHHETAPRCEGPQEDAIRRTTPIALLVASLLTVGAATAYASCYSVQWRVANHTAARSATGSCSTSPDDWGRLLVRCGAKSGRATARYDFTVPSSAGSVAYRGCAEGGSHGSINRPLTRKGTSVSLTVTVSGDDARLQLLSVSIESYTKK